MTEVMFDDDAAGVERARAICAGCGVVVRCAFVALIRPERFGVWGGMSARERDQLVKAAKRSAARAAAG